MKFTDNEKMAKQNHHSSHLKGKKRIVYSKAISSDHGPGTQITVTSDSTSQRGSNFIVLQNKESQNQGQFGIHLERRVQKGRAVSTSLRRYG